MKVAVVGDGHLADITRRFLIMIGLYGDGLSDVDVIWFTDDVPIVNGHADPDKAMRDIEFVLTNAQYQPTAVMLISSQFPVGSIKKLETVFPHLRFACCPENFRQVDGPEAFIKQARFVVGTRNAQDTIAMMTLFEFARHVEWMSIESAEMTKHAINAYLGMCIAFANEIGELSKIVGADIREVERGLMSEERVSPHAPLRAGDAFGLGHIDRDLAYLGDVHETPLIHAIRVSNERKRQARCGQ